MTASLRLAQPRYSREHRDGYHPDIPSDGLTIDTPKGPVDLIAVERILAGQPTPVAKTEIHYITALLPDGTAEHVNPIARGLGIDPASVKRAFERRKEAAR